MEANISVFCIRCSTVGLMTITRGIHFILPFTLLNSQESQDFCCRLKILQAIFLAQTGAQSVTLHLSFSPAQNF